MSKMSDFTKQQIQDCYSEMYDYIDGYEVPDDDEDDSFSYMKSEIEKRKISIPENVYKKIVDFVETELLPLSNGEAFGGMVEAIESDSEDQEIAGQYLWAILKRKDALREFGMKELYPLLTEE